MTKISSGQVIVDSCFTSVNSSTDFISSSDLVNMGSIQADGMEWNGMEWNGTRWVYKGTSGFTYCAGC